MSKQCEQIMRYFGYPDVRCTQNGFEVKSCLGLDNNIVLHFQPVMQVNKYLLIGLLHILLFQPNLQKC